MAARTYELMFPFWSDIAKNPTEETNGINEFAQAIESVPEIIVVSRSLQKVENKRTRIVRSDPQIEIQKLKQQPGKNILTGGVALPSELLEHGLIDEIRLVVHPIVAGKGRRLFDQVSLKEKFQFKLADSQAFRSGCIALRYCKNS